MWVIVPSCDWPSSDSDPAAGKAVSASTETSAAGTAIRTRGFMSFPPPQMGCPMTSLQLRFTAHGGRNQEEPVKGSLGREPLFVSRRNSVPGGRRGRGQIDTLGHLHRCGGGSH